MKIQVFEGANGWYYRIRARNGQILLVSESYTRRSDAVRAARRFREAIVKAWVE